MLVFFQLPPVHQPKPVITPRWIIPTTAVSVFVFLCVISGLTPLPLPHLMQPPAVFTNGLLDLDHPAKVAAFTADGRAAHPPAPALLTHTPTPVISR